MALIETNKKYNMTKSCIKRIKRGKDLLYLLSGSVMNKKNKKIIVKIR